MSVQFYLHSDYSLLESTFTVEALVNKAKQLGIESLALTDHNTTGGHWEFEKLCKKAGIKPIFGLELDILYSAEGQQAPVVIIAVNNQGYANLLHLASQPVPVPMQLLLDFKEGVAILEGGEKGGLTQFLKTDQRVLADQLHAWYQEHFGPAYYLRYDLGQDNKLFSAFPGHQFILSQDVRYADLASRSVLEILGEIGGKDYSIPEYPFLSWDELVQKYAGPASAITTTLELAASCQVQLPREQFLPPHPSDDNLANLVLQGARLRYGQLTESVETRLEYELSIIEEMNFDDYFLIVADIVRFAKNVGIPVGPGRGSAASSLVAYCLGITEVDPLAWGLLFERFLNPGRSTRPDIDLDFCYERRGEVLSYVARRFGQEHVAQIGTYGRFGARSAQQEVKRTLGQENLHLARQIEGLKRHRSTHAAGVIITAQPIQNISAVHQDRELPVTHLDMYSLEELGALKIDLLGLRTLTLLTRMEKEVQRREPNFSLKQIPLDDAQTFQLLSQGKSLGIFQLESALFQDLLCSLQPQCFADLVALLALGRPGPLRIFSEYLRRRQDPSQIEYLHPVLQEILGETYGLILYQEQVILIAHKIGGLSLGEADLLRSALGKANQKSTKVWQQRFVIGAQEVGLTLAEAQELFKTIVEFSGYAFNKAHSVSYALLSWQAAYLKACHPVEFFTTLLNAGSLGKEQSLYLLDCQSLGVNVLPPSVLYSQAETTFEGIGLRLGLKTMRQLSPQNIKLIVEGQKGKGWTNFSGFREELKLDTRTLETLVLSGACDDLGDRNQHLISLGLKALPEKQLLKQERDLLGIYSSKHPTTPFLPLMHRLQGDLQVVVGEIIEVKNLGSKIQGVLDTPQGSVFFQGPATLKNQGMQIGCSIASFGQWEQGLLQVEWALELKPTLLISPSSQDLETIKVILKEQNGTKPIILRLGEGSTYHLLPRQFWLKDVKTVEVLLKKANLVYVWFDPWKEIVS